MLLQGTALIGSVTLEFSVNGKPGEWSLRMKPPGGIPVVTDSDKQSPWDELRALLSDGCQVVSKKRVLT